MAEFVYGRSHYRVDFEKTSKKKVIHLTEEELRAKYEEKAIADAKAWVPTWAKVAIAIVLVLAMVGTCVAAYYYFQHDHAVIMTQEQIKQSAELAKRLDISEKQAQRLAKELKAANEKEPEFRYITRAPTVEQAAVNVKKDIDAGKSPANQIPADKTIVTPNVKEQKVDVYRVTLDKAKLGFNTLVLAGGDLPFEVGAGLSYTNKDWGADAGYTTRNRAYMLGRFYPKFLN